ncbi:MAG: low molecular weight protein arginine phosphatase [Cephaloticoccus sp.]|nr:low molecular weight protein arginine phosphatase [Cephaloticoccus sp.]MCF7761099.1 low molecular weight protein arginine phosphatase [Cephaloticoccus sp.]
MSAPGSILIVCTANICRSPMGEGLLRHALAAEAEPLCSLSVVSAGVAARANETVSENSVVALRKVGIDIAAHLSQPVTQEMLDAALIVLCMTETHRAMIQLQAEPPPRELRLFREFMPVAVDKEVPDPFGGPLKLYEMCRDELVEAIPSIITHLKTLVTEKN